MASSQSSLLVMDTRLKRLTDMWGVTASEIDTSRGGQDLISIVHKTRTYKQEVLAHQEQN